MLVLQSCKKGVWGFLAFFLRVGAILNAELQLIIAFEQFSECGHFPVDLFQNASQ